MEYTISSEASISWLSLMTVRGPYVNPTQIGGFAFKNESLVIGHVLVSYMKRTLFRNSYIMRCPDASVVFTAEVTRIGVPMVLRIYILLSLSICQWVSDDSLVGYSASKKKRDIYQERISLIGLSLQIWAIPYWLLTVDKAQWFVW